MKQRCDWCKQITYNTGIIKHGRNWDIFDDICDDCTQKVLNLRRSRMLYPKEPEYHNRCIASFRLGGYSEEEEVKEPTFKLPKSLGGD